MANSKEKNSDTHTVSLTVSVEAEPTSGSVGWWRNRKEWALKHNESQQNVTRDTRK